MAAESINLFSKRNQATIVSVFVIFKDFTRPGWGDRLIFLVFHFFSTMQECNALDYSATAPPWPPLLVSVLVHSENTLYELD